MKLNTKQKALVVACVKELNTATANARSAGVAIMQTLTKVSTAFPDETATALASLLAENGMEYAPVTIGIYIGTIRKASEKGVNIAGMTNSEAQTAISGGNGASGDGGKPDKAKLLAKLKKLAKQAQKEGASLEEICDSIGLELA